MKAVDVYEHTVYENILEPMHVGSHVPDGLAAAEHLQCMAHSQNTDRQCPKYAAVTLLVDPEEVHTNRHTPVHLCGAHYDRHRRGKPVTLDA